MIRSSKSLTAIAMGMMLFTRPGLPVAEAQQAVIIGASIGEGISPTFGDISNRSMGFFAELLVLTEESKSAAMSLHEGYVAERRAARAERQQEIMSLQKKSQDEEDDSIFMSKLPEVTERFETRLAEIETRFMNDLRLLCDAPDASERWDRVERARRRETALRIGASAGGSIDLIEIVRELNLDSTESAATDPLCIEYENDLDRALISKQKLLDEQALNGPKSLTQIDVAAIEKSRMEMKKSSDQIAEINTSHARKIGGAMTDATRARFEQLIRERSFPRIYRESKISKDLVASLGFGDLSDDQRKAIESIREQYGREVRTLNDAWAAIVRAQDGEGSSVAVSFGGSVGMLSVGDEPEEIARARKAKKDLDAATREKLDSLLTADQRDRLPKEPERDPAQTIMLEGGTSIRVITKPEGK